jgi:hypothetical protein
MRFLIIFLLLITNVLAKEIVKPKNKNTIIDDMNYDMNSGKYHLGIELGNSKTTTLYPEESPSTYKMVSFYGTKTLHITSIIDLELGLGYQTYKGIFQYNSTSLFNSVDYNVKTAYAKINPSFRLTDNFNIGLYKKVFIGPIHLSQTELSMSCTGLNIQYDNFMFKNLRLSGFYETTDGTTSRKITTMGVGLDIGF